MMINHEKLASVIRDELKRQAETSGARCEDRAPNDIGFDGDIQLAALVVAIERALVTAEVLYEID